MNLISQYTTDTEDRIKLIRWTICLAYLATIFVTPQLWFMQLRDMPACPVFKGFSIPDALSAFLAIALVVSLVIIFFGKFLRWSIIAAVSTSVVLILHDINRLQPPFYVFVLFLLFLVFYYDKKLSRIHATTAFQLIVCSIYFWSGIHKFNDSYSGMFSAFVNAFLTEIPTGFLGTFIDGLGILSPWIELLLPLTLLFLPFKRISIAIVILMHLFILSALSLYGVNYSVFPWNLMMAFIVFILFNNHDFIRVSSFKNAYIVFILVLLWAIPILRLFNRYDTFLAFDLYSGKHALAIIYIHADVLPRLPAAIRSQVEISDKKQYRIRLLAWAEKDLQVPIYPESRVFKHYYRYIKSFAASPDDVGLAVFQYGKIIETR